MAEKTTNRTEKSSGNTSKKKKSKRRGISITTLVLIMLAAYFGYSILVGQFTKLNTETAQLVTISDSISTTGTAIRNETVITSDIYGVTASAVENGGKVYKGETIVNVFSSEESAQAYRRIAEIDEALAEFESMKTAAEDNATEISTLEKQLSSRFFSFADSINGGDVVQAAELSDEILYLLNKSQIATKQVDNFDVRMSALKAERDQLSATYGETPQCLKSPLSGYFISDVDGYEGLLNTSILEGLTPERFEAIMSEPVQEYDSSVIGKIADDYVWNIVCTVPAAEAENLKEGSYYTIFMPYSDAESVEARLSKISPSEDGGEQLLIFRCTYMVSDLASFRSQPIEIQKKKFTGLGVSLAAITSREESEEVSGSDGLTYVETKDVPGVYILWGNEVKFKKINELYRDGETVVCAVGTGSEELKMYDEVVVSNEDMYDGKIVNN